MIALARQRSYLLPVVLKIWTLHSILLVLSSSNRRLWELQVLKTANPERFEVRTARPLKFKFVRSITAAWICRCGHGFGTATTSTNTLFNFTGVLQFQDPAELQVKLHFKFGRKICRSAMAHTTTTTSTSVIITWYRAIVIERGFKLMTYSKWRLDASSYQLVSCSDLFFKFQHIVDTHRVFNLKLFRAWGINIGPAVWCWELTILA